MVCRASPPHLARCLTYKPRCPSPQAASIFHAALGPHLSSHRCVESPRPPSADRRHASAAQQAVPVPSGRCQHASLPFCFDASAGALLTHQLICSGAEARLTRTDRVPMKAPGTVYYFSGRASEEQPKQITGRTSTSSDSRCTGGGADARRRGVDPEAAGGVDQEEAAWLLSRPAHANRHPGLCASAHVGHPIRWPR